MDAENSFDIEVAENGIIPLILKRNEDSEGKKYDIYNEKMVHLFSLNCYTDDVKDTHKLSKDFEKQAN